MTPATRNPSKARGAIRTEYNGRTFRSKLEADWARVFDALNLEFEYEKNGRYFGDIFYLPDFWLPRSRQFVEVKGEFEPADCRKICALLTEFERHDFAQDDIPIVAAMPAGVFYGWRHGANVGTSEAWLDFLTESAVQVELFRCEKCQGWWFADPDESWRCRCCGKYDGAKFVADRIPSPLPRRIDHVDETEKFDIDLLRAIGAGDPITTMV